MNASKAEFGLTALMLACSHGHLDVVRELYRKGANVNATTMQNCTPLVYASRKGHFDIARFLVLQGANKNVPTIRGDTAFSVACGPHKAALQTLLSSSSDV